MRRYTLGLRGRQFVIDVQEHTADRFEVIVDGASYEVTLTGDEDLPEAVITPGYQPLAQANGTTPAVAIAAPITAAALPPPTQRGSGSTALNAPMPGVILELFVKPGDQVQRGQQVAVLDAMKMHNFIGAPCAGTIAEVCVAVGQAVGHGDAIVRYAEA